jgi:hypothetical protein
MAQQTSRAANANPHLETVATPTTAKAARLASKWRKTPAKQERSAAQQGDAQEWCQLGAPIQEHLSGCVDLSDADIEAICDKLCKQLLLQECLPMDAAGM